MSDTPSNPSSDATGKSAKKKKKDSVWEVYVPRGLNEDKDAVPIASFPMIIYFWPSMITMLVCGLFARFTETDPVTLGWWAVGMLSFNLMTIVTDLDQKKFVIFILVLTLIGVGLYVAHLKEMSILSDITKWISGLAPTFSVHAYFLLFFMLWFFFVLGMLQPRLDYWRFEPNEFVHYVQPWGRDQSIPRQGSTVAREVPDVLELMLTFGGGTLVIRREGQVVARIEHVPFLGRRMIALERLLGVTRVQHVDAG